MKILSRIIIIALSLTLAACGGGKQFSLKGKIEGQNALSILIYSPNGGFEGYDTIKVKNGKFSYKRELKDSAIITLLFPRDIRTTLVASPGDGLKYEASASTLAKAVVEGSEDNELLTKFRISIADKAGPTLISEARKFVKQHPKTMAALAVFEQYILMNPHHTRDDLNEPLQLLKKSQPYNPYISRLKQQLHAELNVNVGQKAPTLTLQTLDGKNITVGNGMERPTAILFLAAWMEASLQQSALAQKLRKELQGKVDIVVVSLDYNPIEFKQRLGADTLSLPIVCDGRVWQSPVVQKLGVRSIPGNILIDSNGLITARDIPQVDLEQKIRDLMK
jgi:hypothetical protein